MDKGTGLRRSFGKFATVVTVVTCAAGDGSPRGITANSFGSVSVEPPLVSWNIARVSDSLDAFLAAEYFAIHVIAGDQQPLSEHFARTDHQGFDGIEHSLSVHGVPILPGVLACFDCRTREIHDGGDHHIIVGEIIGHQATAGDPLLFFGGDYRRIG